MTVRTASGLGASVSTDAPSPTAFEYHRAEINADSVIDAEDAAVLFHALSHRDILGGGTGGGIAELRQQLLGGCRGTLPTTIPVMGS